LFFLSVFFIKNKKEINNELLTLNKLFKINHAFSENINSCPGGYCERYENITVTFYDLIKGQYVTKVESRMVCKACCATGTRASCTWWGYSCS